MNHIGLSRLAITIAFVSLVFNNSVLLASGPISYSTIGDKLISSYGIIGTHGTRGAKQVDSNGIPKLSVHDQRKLVFSLLAEHDHQNLDDDDSPDRECVNKAMHNILESLELFYVKGKTSDHSNHLFSKFNHTVTGFGEAYLAKMLVSPVDDMAALRKRQAFIRQLYHDEALFNELNDVVMRMKKAESGLFSLWVEDDAATKSLIRSLYFSSDLMRKYNSDPSMLTAHTGLQYVLMARGLYEDVLIASFMLYITGCLEQKMGNEGILTVPGALKKATSNTFWPGGDVGFYYQVRDLDMSQDEGKKELADVLDKMGIPKTKDLGKENQTSALWWLRFGIAFKTLLLGKRVYGVKSFIDSAKNVQALLKRLQIKVISSAAYVQGLARIDKILQRNDDLKNGLFAYDALYALFDAESAKTEKFNEMLKQLQTHAFKKKNAALVNPGSILSAYGLIRDTKADLIGALEAFGELDACLSVVKLMKKSEHERVGYTFVDFVERDKPFIALEGLWNPQIDSSVVVPNNVELGGDNGVRAMIITGSNTGGKSTLLKAATLNILMAHTFGIAPARAAVMTPFTFVGTSLNIVDNTADGDSLYKAEVESFVFMRDSVARLTKTGKKCFLVIDELFRGTGPEKADKETYNSAKRLNAFDNTLYILATHFFNNPLKLEKETRGVCKNYKVDAYIDSNNKIIRPFTLEEGVCSNNIADDILNGALDNDN